MAPKRLLILGAVLIVTGIGTPIAAILLDGPGSEARRPSAELPTPDEWLDPDATPEEFTEVTEPPASETTAPVTRAPRGRDGKVAPGSGSRPIPATTTPPTSAPVQRPDAVSVPPAPTTTTTDATPPPEAEPPILLPMPLPQPVETDGPTVVPPPPLPED
jgi:hypothetical protein